MSAKSEGAIEIMRAMLAADPSSLIHGPRMEPFFKAWFQLAYAMALRPVDKQGVPLPVAGAFESTMAMLADSILREEHADLLAVAELLEHRRSRRFLAEVARWVQPLFDAKDPPEGVANYCRALVLERLPAVLSTIDPRAGSLTSTQVGAALDRARSVEGVAALLAVFSGACGGAPLEGETEKQARARMSNKFRGFRDKQEERRITET